MFAHHSADWCETRIQRSIFCIQDLGRSFCENLVKGSSKFANKLDPDLLTNFYHGYSCKCLKQQNNKNQLQSNWEREENTILDLRINKKGCPKIHLEAISRSRFFKKVYSSSEFEDIAKHAKHVAHLCGIRALFFCSSMNLTYKRSLSTPT